MTEAEAHIVAEALDAIHQISTLRRDVAENLVGAMKLVLPQLPLEAQLPLQTLIYESEARIKPGCDDDIRSMLTSFTGSHTEAKPPESIDRILDFIKENPGATPQDIREGVPGAEIGYRGSRVNVTHSLRVLKARGVIENRGPKEPGKGPGRWHATNPN